MIIDTSRRRTRCLVHDKGEEGASAAEMVVVIPAFMLLILVAVQLALWAHAYHVVQSAAARGDETARNYGGSPGSGAATAHGFVDSVGSGLLDGVRISSEAEPGGMVEVDVSGHVEAILPWLNLTVASRSIGPVQQFRSGQ